MVDVCGLHAGAPTMLGKLDGFLKEAVRFRPRGFPRRLLLQRPYSGRAASGRSIGFAFSCNISHASFSFVYESQMSGSGLPSARSRNGAALAMGHSCRQPGHDSLEHTCRMSLTRYSTSGASTLAASALSSGTPIDSAIAEIRAGVIAPLMPPPALLTSSQRHAPREHVRCAR